MPSCNSLMDNLKIATFGITMKMNSIIDAVLCCLFISPDCYHEYSLHFVIKKSQTVGLKFEIHFKIYIICCSLMFYNHLECICLEINEYKYIRNFQMLE